MGPPMVARHGPAYRFPMVCVVLAHGALRVRIGPA
jgi:hypothetical protein